MVVHTFNLNTQEAETGLSGLHSETLSKNQGKEKHNQKVLCRCVIFETDIQTHTPFHCITLYHFIYLILCVWLFCLHVCLYPMCVPSAQRPEEGIGFPGAEVMEAAVLVLRIEHGSSAGASDVLNH